MFLRSRRLGRRPPAAGFAIPISSPASCRPLSSSGPCGCARWYACAARAPGGRAGDERPGRCRSPSCGGCRRRRCGPSVLLALPLFVAWVGADDAHGPVTADHLALLAHLLDRGTNFHVPFLLVITCTGR